MKKLITCLFLTYIVNISAFAQTIVEPPLGTGVLQ